MSGPPRLSLALLSLALAACQTAAAPGATCARSAECGSPLVCRYGRCRTECSTNRDCGPSQSCIFTLDHEGVCQLEADLDCEGGVGRMCPSGLVCANDRCINPCTTSADCPSDGVCQFSPSIGLHVCVDPGRVDLDAGPRPDGGVPVSPCSVVTDVCAGDQFACAIRDGHVICWGDDTLNQHGDLVLGGFAASYVLGPDLAPLHDVVEIGCGTAHACARTATRDVLCWGDNGANALAQDTTVRTDRAAYVQVDTSDPLWLMSPRVEAVGLAIGGQHSCAQRTMGRWACWGDDTEGELNISVASPGTTFGRVTSTTLPMGATLFSLGQYHSCFADAAGVVTCTGSAAVEELSTPGALAALGSVRDLALGLHHSCALTQSGVLCWGSNGLDQLGVGALALMDPGCSFPPCSFTPVDVALPAVADLVDGADADTACAITQDGQLACWGENASGEADGTLSLAPSPVVRTDLPGVVCDASIGGQTICALVASSTGGDVYCWGANPNGQLGTTPDGVAHPTPVLVTLPAPP